MLRSTVVGAAALGTGATLALAGPASAGPITDAVDDALAHVPPVQVPDVPLPGGQTLPDALQQAGVPIARDGGGASIDVGTPGRDAAPEPLSEPNFATPRITPSENAVVGVAQPIIIDFPQPVADHAAAERAIRVTNDKSVPGAFHWFGDSEVRWRPENLWPGHTQVTVEAGDAVRHFTIGDAIIATADDATKTITVTRDGEVVRTMPTSMGKPGHYTPNGIYTVGERFETMIMDSSTYGVPVDSPEGYRLEVHYATRMSNGGIFLHAAPWSLGAQGNTDTSHGCLNVSTPDAKWFYDNAQPGDAVIVVNSPGGHLDGRDGLTDFSMPWGAWAD